MHPAGQTWLCTTSVCSAKQELAKTILSTSVPSDSLQQAVVTMVPTGSGYYGSNRQWLLWSQQVVVTMVPTGGGYYGPNRKWLLWSLWWWILIKKFFFFLISLVGIHCKALLNHTLCLCLNIFTVSATKNILLAVLGRKKANVHSVFKTSL